MLSTAYCREGTESRRPGGWRAGFRNDQGMPIPCLAHGLLARQVHGHRVTVQYPVGLTPPSHEAQVPQLSSAREPKGFRNVSLTPQPCCYEINERCRNFPGKVQALFRLRIWCLFLAGSWGRGGACRQLANVARGRPVVGCSWPFHISAKPPQDANDDESPPNSFHLPGRRQCFRVSVNLCDLWNVLAMLVISAHV
jgi:hypothetical protein